MILILISIIVAFGVSAVLMRAESFLAAFAGMVICIASGVAAIAYAFAGWSWFASEYKADIINREYGTKYSQQEIFWASDVIDTIRELDRKRYEVNGDFRRQQADTKADRDARSYGNDQRK